MLLKHYAVLRLAALQYRFPFNLTAILFVYASVVLLCCPKAWYFPTVISHSGEWGSETSLPRKSGCLLRAIGTFCESKGVEKGELERLSKVVMGRTFGKLRTRRRVWRLRNLSESRYFANIWAVRITVGICSRQMASVWRTVVKILLLSYIFICPY